MPLLLDLKLDSYVSLVENIILLGHGKLTDSFMSILISQKEFSKDQYQLTDPWMTPKKRNAIKGLIPYESLKCFVSLAQENIERFTVTADRLASVFKETGSSENPAGKKLFQLLLLAKGGELPSFVAKPEAKKNSYADMFKKMFGSQWKGMITLHKLLTLPSKELAVALEKIPDPQIPEDETVTNVRKWAY